MAISYKLMNYSYMARKPKTMEEVQRDVDALTHSEFIARTAAILATASIYGSSAYYFGGVLTENAMLQRALVNRLARINGDVDRMNSYTQEFKKRDDQQAAEAKEVADAPAPNSGFVWIDTFSYRRLCSEMSVSQALLTTYPVAGCVPLRPLTPEEIKALDTTEL